MNFLTCFLHSVSYVSDKTPIIKIPYFQNSLLRIEHNITFCERRILNIFVRRQTEIGNEFLIFLYIMFYERVLDIHYIIERKNHELLNIYSFIFQLFLQNI